MDNSLDSEFDDNGHSRLVVCVPDNQSIYEVRVCSSDYISSLQACVA